jgi:hypothetical protein
MNSIEATAAGMYHLANARGLNSSSIYLPLTRSIAAKLLRMRGKRKAAAKTVPAESSKRPR